MASIPLPEKRKPKGLRKDLKISKQVMRERTNFVVKDPLKNQYFRFEKDEWDIIALFNGVNTFSEMVRSYGASHPAAEINEDFLKDYEKTLDTMNLLEKSSHEMNIMLVEKMKEMRQSQLLSKKGSLMYKRFPLVDPDEFFNRIIPHIGFFWTKKFMILSALSILFGIFLVMVNWTQFHNGVYEVFSFSKLSVWNIAFLWVTIYSIIAIHELGHGLTCKYYGGQVHEIGFLLLFFQPCLYANVNDAWLFDKKWKQVAVTVAGGYIEFFIGSLFTILWAITSPNTTVNVLCLQVMTICSVSTVLFNFNPLMKLDGYYLLADYLEIPNLRDSAFSFLKHFVSKYVFFMNKEDFEATPREKMVYFIYGTACFFWVATSTLGLFYMAKSFLIDTFFAVGVLMSFWVAHKIFGGHVSQAGAFAKSFIIKHIGFFRSWKGKLVTGGTFAVIALVLLVPVAYTIKGACNLAPQYTRVLRSETNGFLASFSKRDGDLINTGDTVAVIENAGLSIDKSVTHLSLENLKVKSRQTYKENLNAFESVQREIASKSAELDKATGKVESLQLKYSDSYSGLTVLSCDDQLKKTRSFVKEGDEICKVHGIHQLFAVVEVMESEVSYVKIGDEVLFKLTSDPFHTFSGKVHRIRSLGTPDPTNPKAKLYSADIIVSNTGKLRPGMTGIAKIISERISVARFLGRRLAGFFRLDLFY